MKNPNQIPLIQKKYQDYQYPMVSMVIPCFNDSAKIGLTLNSLLGQNYRKFEIIIIDGGSEDRTLEVVKGFRDERIQVFSVSGFQQYEMLNRGIAQAGGVYINCLFPGDFYIYPGTLSYMMELALDNDLPDLAYCGTLLRDGRTEPKIMRRDWKAELLQRGQQPTSLQSCWFKIEIIRKIGKFNVSFKIRGGFELMCRLLSYPNFSVVSTHRVFTDYDLRQVTRKMILCHFIETFRTIKQYFGWKAVIYWLFIQKDVKRLVKIMWRQVKMAFLGQ